MCPTQVVRDEDFAGGPTARRRGLRSGPGRAEGGDILPSEVAVAAEIERLWETRYATLPDLEARYSIEGTDDSARAFLAAYRCSTI